MLGRLVADEIQVPFIDLDDSFSVFFKETPGEFIIKNGEEKFRLNERNIFIRTIKELDSDAVIATGGGLPCYFDNMKLLCEEGTTIYLRASVDFLLDRLYNRTVDRPLLGKGSREAIRCRIRSLLKQREIYYNQARYTIDIEHLQQREIVEDIIRICRGKRKGL